MCIDAESASQLTEDLFLRYLTRFPTKEEKKAFATLLEAGFDDRILLT